MKMNILHKYFKCEQFFSVTFYSKSCIATSISAGIILNGLPPLNSLKPICSRSSTSQSTAEGQHIALENKTLSEFVPLFTSQCLQEKIVNPSMALWPRYPHGIPYFSSESDIKMFVKCSLSDLAEEVGLTDLIFASEISLFDKDKADIWVIYLFGIPVGVIEVKKPQPKKGVTSPTDDLCHLGQLFDYVYHLRAYAGRQYAFGILTTYHEWRIVWLPDNDDIARSNTLFQQNRDDQREKLISALPQVVPKWDAGLCDFYPENSSAKPLELERNLCVSRIYRCDHPDLPNIIVSVLEKMSNSPLIPPNPSMLVKHRPYIYLSHENMEWHHPKENRSLVIEGRVPEYFQTVYLLADLGGGGDGRVWLATTPNGKVCVVKFSSDRQILERECKIWNNLWPSTRVCVKKLWKKDVLVMPWAKPCSQQEFNSPEIKALVKRNLARLTEAGLKHDDMKLSHVGLYRKADELDVVFFDFARISNISADSKTSAVAEMMEKLLISEDYD